MNRTLILLTFSLATTLLPGQKEMDLFSPNNLALWKTKGQVALSKSENGVQVKCLDGDAWMAFALPADHFSLKGQFLLGRTAVASVAFRIPDLDTKLPALDGYAISLNRDNNQQNTLGSIINLARAKTIDSLNLDTWNQFEIIAEGDHLQVKINEQLVAETSARRSYYGYFMINAQGDGISLKSLVLKVDPHGTLPSKPSVEDLLSSYPDREYQSIFDGQSLKGWKTTGTSVWFVEDGVLHGFSGIEGGFLVSDDAYRNFHLKCKFKIAKEDNSGIFIRKPVDAPTISLTSSVECNIYDFNGYTHAYSTGSLATHARAWSNLIDYDDWNTADIFAYEDQIIMYINGRKSSEAYLPAYNYPGNICLQAGLQLLSPDQGSSDVYFKDLMIKTID
jgi:hypothetical protein